MTRTWFRSQIVVAGVHIKTEASGVKWRQGNVALPPGGAVRSQVDQGEATQFPKNNLKNEPQYNI